MAELFYLSDKAYDYIVEQGVKAGFIKETSARRAGISRFLELLSYRAFMDNRPQSLREYDESMRANRRTPLWATGLRDRRQRSMIIDSDTKLRYGKIALDVGIYVDRWHKGGPAGNSPNSIVSSVLEAIGIKYLMPDQWPELLDVNPMRDMNEILSQRRA